MSPLSESGHKGRAKKYAPFVVAELIQYVSAVREALIVDMLRRRGSGVKTAWNRLQNNADSPRDLTACHVRLETRHFH